jgi:hypothetical protein
MELKRENNERMNEGILNIYSDHKVFYKGTELGMPDLDKLVNNGVELASHGFIHVDHRLLSYELQEWNIIQSCAIIGTNKFVPPRHKWNHDTELVCVRNDIRLIKVENHWRHLKYHKVDTSNGLEGYYFHTFDFDNSQQLLEQL